MNDRLAADLGRWERGELRADELREHHPDGEADELLQMHARVSLALSAADEQPDLRWEEIEARLDLDLDAEAERDEELVSRKRRVPVLKLVIAFVAGALVNPFQPAERAVDGMRAVARSTADAVVEEVIDVFGPMMPPRAGGVVVLDPGTAQNLSAVAPQTSPPPSGPAEPGEPTTDPVSPPSTMTDPISEPAPHPTSEPRDAVEQDPVDSDEPADSGDPEEDATPSDPDPGSPSTPPGQQRRAERSPVHGGEKADPAPPGHGRQLTSPPGHTQRPPHAGAASTNTSASGRPEAGPASKMGGEHPRNDHGGTGDRGKAPR